MSKVRRPIFRCRSMVSSLIPTRVSELRWRETTPVDFTTGGSTPRPTSMLGRRLYASTGAILIGRRMFDVGFEPWGDPPPFRRPVFVLTHEKRDPLPMQRGTTYFFVTNGNRDRPRAGARRG
jgi:dihydrofolate reductase